MQEDYKEPTQESLNEEITQKVKKIDPALFENLVSDISMVVNNFKNYLPAFETMQATNPKAYEAIVNVVMTMISLSQILLESGDLKTDAQLDEKNNLPNSATAISE